MSELVVRPQRGLAASYFLVAGALLAVAVGAAAGGPVIAVAGVGAVGALATATVLRRPVVSWKLVLGGLVLVILFIPLRRYVLPGDAGFKLEPYRLLVAVIVAGWGACLLTDPRVRLRRSGLERPMAYVALAVFGSILTNPGRVASLEPTVLKAVTFLLSFFIVFYLVVSVVRTQEIADSVAKTLVAGGALVAVSAVVESRTGFSVFDRLETVFPFLVQDPGFLAAGVDRGGTTRAVASAEHPIALGAAMVMLVPLALYVVRVSGPVWYAALGTLVVGAVTSVSRTAIVMLLVVVIVFLWLRPADTRRLWPLLIPMLVAIHFVAPGTLGSLKESFMPEGGLIAEQQTKPGDCNSSGRVADIGPTLADVAKQPAFGYGYGTRIVTGPEQNACILDNQWLGTLYEVGVFGFMAWIALFLGVARRFGRAAREDHSPTGWLMVAGTASLIAYAFANFTFDALGFSQVTFILFIVLGLTAAAAANQRRSPPAPQG